MSQSNKTRHIQKNPKATTVTGLTLVRLFFIPILFVINDPFILFVVINILFATDFLDGYLARKWEVTSRDGAILDLIADKSIVIIILFVAWGMELLSIWILLLISYREISSMIMRIKLMKQGKELVPASKIGKTKTALQFLAIDMMFLNIPGYELLFWIVIIIAYYSYFQYFFKGRNNE